MPTLRRNCALKLAWREPLQPVPRLQPCLYAIRKIRGLFLERILVELAEIRKRRSHRVVEPIKERVAASRVTASGVGSHRWSGRCGT